MMVCKIIDGNRLPSQQYSNLNFREDLIEVYRFILLRINYLPDLSRRICNITSTMSTDEDEDGIDDTFSLIVEPETGYSYIVD